MEDDEDPNKSKSTLNSIPRLDERKYHKEKASQDQRKGGENLSRKIIGQHKANNGRKCKGGKGKNDKRENKGGSTREGDRKSYCNYVNR